jgi:hypothetical protein
MSESASVPLENTLETWLMVTSGEPAPDISAGAAELTASA